MAQGAIKKSAKPTSGGRKSGGVLKPQGSRVIAPKKAKLIQQRKLQKKHTSGTAALTERKLAERAGHLEILGGGKKDKAKAQAGAQKNKKSK